MSGQDPDFSQPDPAVPKADEAGLVPERGSMLEMIDLDVTSCTNCSHFSVCAIWKGIAPMMADWPQEEEDEAAGPPVDPNHLALICEQFDPIEV